MHKLIRPIPHLFHDFHNKKASAHADAFSIRLRIIRQMELIERIEHKAHDHADDSGEVIPESDTSPSASVTPDRPVTKMTEVRIMLRFLL